MSLKEIMYVSRSTVRPMSDLDMDDLLKNARQKNSDNNITGALLYDGKNFMQILEGDEQDVINVYKRILSDPRHKDIITLSNENVKMRCFGSWAMVYKRHRPKEPDLHELGSFIHTASDSDEAALMARNVFFEEFNLDPRNRYETS